MGCFLTVPPCCPSGSPTPVCIYCYGDEAPSCLLVQVVGVQQRPYDESLDDDSRCGRFCELWNRTYKLLYQEDTCSWFGYPCNYEGEIEVGCEWGPPSLRATLGITEDGDYVLIAYFGGWPGTAELDSFSYNFGPDKPDCTAWNELRLDLNPWSDDLQPDGPSPFCEFSYAYLLVTASSDNCDSFACEELTDPCLVAGANAPFGGGCCCGYSSEWALDFGAATWTGTLYDAFGNPCESCTALCEAVTGIYIFACDDPVPFFYEEFDGVQCYLAINIMSVAALLGIRPPGHALHDALVALNLVDCCSLVVDIAIGDTLGCSTYSEVVYYLGPIEEPGANLCEGPYTLQKVLEYFANGEPGAACYGSLPDTITLTGV